MDVVPSVQSTRLTAESYVIPVYNGQLLAPVADTWRPLDQSQLAKAGGIIASQHLLGYFDQRPCWAVELVSPEIEAAYQWIGLRSQAGLIDEDQFVLAGRALQIVQWHLDHEFCGRCGRATEHDECDRSKVCQHCNLRFYPRLSPCVIVLITRGNECLLARHSRSKAPLYTALAGFVEVGERVEDTLHREVMEEVGLKIHSLRYFHSQPWPFPGQLMLGFHAQWQEGDIQVDGEEIIDAQWWRYDNLPQVPPLTTLAGQLINHFVHNNKH